MENREIKGGFRTINPANEKTIKEYTYMTDADANEAVEKCHKAYLSWRKKSLKSRGDVLKAIGKGLMDRRPEFAELMTQEMGKVVKHGFQEIKLCAGLCEYTANEGAKELKDEERELPDGGKGIVTYSPMGVIYGIQPWNFPCYQAIRFAIANLIAGNGVLLKHAENVTGSALLLKEIFEDAGLPKHLFTVLIIDHQQSDTIIENNLVRGVTLTGSAAAGKIIAKKAGEQLKKTVLELGSNDAYIVLADADIKLAVETCVRGRIYNNGETCVAAKRFVVVESVYNEFEKAFVNQMKAIKTGDPTKKETALGPMAREDLREKIHQQVEESIANGAKILTGGKLPSGKGFFYPATVLGNVKPGQPAYHDELFGPVASLIKAKNDKDAMRIANDSRFGLGGGIFSKDEKKAIKLAQEEFDTGMVYINSFGLAQPNMPFGGVKDSGYGREHGGFGMKEFVNVKAVMVL
ncbi:NAD-dependent succinate-semialdehyde dehydrogenase [Ulvibacter antarcticus]|uniref:Succinate-semialdehyde dehydrogenase/glutarate-semialdehyde dehydrogenase n=1 Tax=Ulvibacter antarcticus TaxID=442714 RepID=A0A3L9YZ00_9FLAO|nr:NAD-dependent succinate-semialdehyde dehydrogenase [Ulvibacter antarcticus]RMA64299.1 succinate-semialdehyde dehydrogenase/glutarate-semialdehyde dehydrogenase [Ulvibacter antarcticus]